MFVATAATIISGAVAERLKFFSYVIITFFSSGFFYPIVGHWSWAFNFENPTQKFGWLGKLGYLDFAGASVVHSVGGWIALAVLLVVDNRTGRFREDGIKKTFEYIKKRGTRPFDYNIDIEINNELTPTTWKNKEI